MPLSLIYDSAYVFRFVTLLVVRVYQSLKKNTNRLSEQFTAA